MKKIAKSLLLCFCLNLFMMPAAWAAETVEGTAVSKVGEYNAVELIYGEGISVGMNYTIAEHTIVITDKPADAQVEVYFTAGSLHDFNRTGKLTLMAYCDRPGAVQASFMLRLTEEKSGDTKFINGTTDMVFHDAQTFPDGAAQSLVLVAGSAEMICDGQIYPLEAALTIKQDRLYMPLRAVSTAFALASVYNEASGSVQLTQNERTLSFTVGSGEVQLSDGETLQMDVPVLAEDGYILLPVRYIAQIFGYMVSVSDSTNPLQVIITR